MHGLAVFALPILIAGVAAADPQAPATPAGPSVEIYGRLPNLENVAVSPDGTRLAFVTTLGDERVVAVKSLADNQLLTSFRAGPDKLRNVDWADNNRVLITVSKTSKDYDLFAEQAEIFGLMSCDLTTKQLNDVMKFSLVPAANFNKQTFIIGEPKGRSIQGEPIVMVPGFGVAPDRYFEVFFKVNLSHDTGSVLQVGEWGHNTWLVDEQGDVVASEGYSEETRHWNIKVRSGGHLQEALSGDAEVDYPAIAGIAPDGSSVWVQSHVGTAVHWQRLGLQDRKLGEDIPEAASWTDVLTNRQGDQVIGGIISGDYPRYYFLDPQLQKNWDTIVRGSQNAHLTLVSASDDYSKLVVLAATPENGPRFLLVDLNTAHVASVGLQYKDLPAVAEITPINYPAADGLNIPGYLLLPPNRPAKALPLIVFPHGGPAVRDTPDFDYWAQAMAVQGYAVLQPNFRGSTVTQAFRDAGNGQWGRKMQTDLSDGVRYLAAQGLIDPARVCIVGGSYGGYAALAGVSLEPDVYRCAVSVAGISDPSLFLAHISKLATGTANSNLRLRYWEQFMGVKGPGDSALDAISPIKHVNAIRAPVLLIHGRDDAVVPYEQTAEMASALKNAHKSYQQVDLKAEDHWLSRSATRTQMLQATIAFLRTNNPP
jgi:dipeptidyl aminopeptidase/acylaminoacyl peptidase